MKIVCVRKDRTFTKWKDKSYERKCFQSQVDSTALIVTKSKKKVVTTNNHKSFNFLRVVFTRLEIITLVFFHSTSTNLYPYHNDNSSGLRVLHRLYNKAHIGCSSGRDGVEMRKLRTNIAQDRYKSDTTRDMSYISVLVDHNIACSDIQNIVPFPVESDLDMLYKQEVLLLLFS